MKDLRKVYPTNREVLKGIWLSFLPGAKIGVLGSNGAGKSTLLRIMAGIEQEFLGVSPETSAVDVIKKMKAAGLGCALVLEGGNLIGIFTERDLLNKLTGKAAKSSQTLVRDLRKSAPRWRSPFPTKR